VIPFADSHQRQLPRLTAGPFRYQVHAGQYLQAARQHARVPVKQAVIAPSALSLLYPADGIGSYPRKAFLDDLAAEAEADIRSCLDAGAHVVQLDFTEGRLSLKLDPGGQLLEQFIALNNQVLERFTEAERARRPATFRPISWEPATTAASRRSRTTPPPPATPPSPRSHPGSREPRSRPSSWDSDRYDNGQAAERRNPR